MNLGIRLSLQSLAETARRDSSEQLRRLARDLTDAVPDIPGKVRALVDALHRSGARSVIELVANPKEIDALNKDDIHVRGIAKLELIDE